jgi:hypothetical protein
VRRARARRRGRAPRRGPFRRRPCTACLVGLLHASASAARPPAPVPSLWPSHALSTAVFYLFSLFSLTLAPNPLLACNRRPGKLQAAEWGPCGRCIVPSHLATPAPRSCPVLPARARRRGLCRPPVPRCAAGPCTHISEAQCVQPMRICRVRGVGTGLAGGSRRYDGGTRYGAQRRRACDHCTQAKCLKENPAGALRAGSLLADSPGQAASAPNPFELI